MLRGSYGWYFTYDAGGLRTQRTNGAITYQYVYNGSQLVQMTVGSHKLEFFYDASGAPVVVLWNGTPYYYVTSLQGDVVLILDNTGELVVSYDYDAWGNILAIGGSLAPTLGAYNPLRYRGYVYDSETGLYYLQSRYYNPIWGRFLNADALVSTGQGNLGNNMFAYCRNNPVSRKDASGMADYDCVDDTPLDEEDILDIGRGGGGGASAGYSYTTPPGGGGVSSTIQVGDITVMFGHGGRHMNFTDISGIENAIAQNVVTLPPTQGQGKEIKLIYSGTSFNYRYWTIDEHRIKVGTYFYTVAK